MIVMYTVVENTTTQSGPSATKLENLLKSENILK